MEAWRIEAQLKDSESERYPPVAASYVFKSETGDPVTSMDGTTRVFAHYLPSVVQAPAQTITQPASDGKVKIKLIYQDLDPGGRYIRVCFDLRVRPDESEQDLLEHWSNQVRNDGSNRLPEN
jgi:hypothetical protein